jgi:ABC-type transport system substrate-binding protein
MMLLLFCGFKISFAEVTALRPVQIPLLTSAISLDPTQIMDAPSLLVNQQITCQLMHMQNDQPQLEAAQSVRFLTPTRIEIRLRKNLEFTNGTPVTAEDVVDSIRFLKLHKEIIKNVMKWISSVNQLKEQKQIGVIITLKKPIRHFLTLFSAESISIYPAWFLKQVIQNPSLWNQPISCGKYAISKRTIHTIMLTPHVPNALPID